MILWRPTDSDIWANSVSESYGLPLVHLGKSDCHIYLNKARSFGLTTYFSSGAYATDGGVKNEDLLTFDLLGELSDLLMRENGSHLVLKMRTKIKVPHHPQSEGVFFFFDENYVTFVLDLTDGIDAIWTQKIKSKTRNQIRKAQKAKFRVVDGHHDLLDDFYKVISKAWRNLGTPMHGKFLFKKLLENLGEEAMLKVIYDKQLPVAAAMVTRSNGWVHHPFAATIPEYKSTSVNNLLYWSIIEQSCQGCYKYFDMGRSRRDQGTFFYKASWGAKPVSLYYLNISKSNKLSSVDSSNWARMMTHVWRELPVPLANFLGPSLIKRVM